MITVDGSAFDHVELTVAAPFTADDVTAAGESLRALAGTPALQRVVMVVTSIGLPAPKAVWEDLKLAPLMSQIRWIALVTDVEWYARVAEIAAALWPGLTLEHFHPGEASAARRWLAAQHDHADPPRIERGMTLRLGSVVINCSDIELLTAFWTQALDLRAGPLSTEGDFRVLGGEHVNLSLQRSPSQPDKRDHLHLDLYTADQQREVRRLQTLGAHVVRSHHDPADDYVVMTDPEGNFFCVCAVESPPAGTGPSS